MIKYLILVSLLIHCTLAADHVPPTDPKIPANPNAPKKWLTLNGEEPLVIARGGFSGLFPESSQFANEMAIQLSLSNVALFCNVQLTKDSVGICSSDIRLDNFTTIAVAFPKGKKTYKVNGKEMEGWFAKDFTSKDLYDQVFLTQSIFSRPSTFDGTLPISAVDDVAGLRPPQFWMNMPYDQFYAQNNLSGIEFTKKSMRGLRANYLSSPEINFLKAMNGQVNKMRTKLIFQLLDAETVEPTSNQQYGSFAKNLSFVKTFASGILVPKEYIWPVATKYLGNPTSLVIDAHKEGLEVYASGFANDLFSSYNYSFDPTNEYLQFIDNGEFSVDGFLTDFPPTASEAIACFANNKNATNPRRPRTLVITSNGASGIYPGGSDLAYQQAVDDGADIIDCSVQLSKDGVAFCLDSADLMGKTTATTSFMSRSTTVKEVQPNAGIFSFDLTWNEIESLKPQLVSPYLNPGGFERNPAHKNKGRFVTLNEFLEFAKTKAVTGVLINIKNAGYLASSKGLDIVVTVTSALSNATFDKQSTQQVLIQSDDSSVLMKFKDVQTYKRVLALDKKIGDAPKDRVEEVKKYADAVNVPRASIMKVSESFTTGLTNVVNEMHAANISVYVNVLRNEYITLAFDYFSDPIVEIATYVQSAKVDGIVTEYPGTASKYMKSPCTDTDPKAKVPYNILPAEPGSLLTAAAPETQPPATAPNPPLGEADVVDPPLPPVNITNRAQTPAPGTPSDSSTPATGSGASAPSSALANVANMGLSVVAILVLSLL